MPFVSPLLDAHTLVLRFRFEHNVQALSPPPPPPRHGGLGWDMTTCSRLDYSSEVFTPSTSSPWKECIILPSLYIGLGHVTCLANSMIEHKQRLDMYLYS